jgi:hypothetical protein
MSRCDVLLIDESTNLDKAGVGYLAERLAPTGKQTLLVIHRDELVAAMPQPTVVERAPVPGYWSCFDCCSPSPGLGRLLRLAGHGLRVLLAGLRGLLVGLVGPVLRGFANGDLLGMRAPDATTAPARAGPVARRDPTQPAALNA